MATQAILNANCQLANPFTMRELDIFTGMVQGLPNKIIAERHSISPNTVKIYTQYVYRKAGFRAYNGSRIELLRWAMQKGMVEG